MWKSCQRLVIKLYYIINVLDFLYVILYIRSSLFIHKPDAVPRHLKVHCDSMDKEGGET